MSRIQQKYALASRFRAEIFVDSSHQSVLVIAMSRPVRIEYPEATYHIMSRGVAKMPTFLDDRDRSNLLRLLNKFVEDERLVVHAFALMSNHYHLLAETPSGHLGRIMQGVLCRYSRKFNQRHGREGHLWQRRYEALLVQDGEYFLRCSRYIHRNPLKAGLCNRPEEYPWSSCRNYFGGLEPVWRGVDTQRTLSHFEDREAYKEYVEMEGGAFDPFTHARAGLVLGDKAFLRRVRRVLRSDPGSDSDLLNLRRLKRSDEAPSFAEIDRVIRNRFADYSPCQRKRVLTFALHCLTWLKRSEIAQCVGRRPDTITRCIQTMDTKLRNDAVFSKRFEDLRQRFGQRREP